LARRADHRALRAPARRAPALHRAGRSRPAGDPGLGMVSGEGHILALNAGSSSLKLGLFDAAGEEQIAERQVAWNASDPPRHDAPLEDLLAEIDLKRIVAVGHRVVHGGARFTEPVLINADVRGEIEALSVLAPLHNRPALDTIAQ